MKYALGAALTLALMTPALAQEFYIVQEPSTKRCTVVAEKPSSSVVVMGNGKVYTSRDEALSAVKEVCTTSTTGSSTTTTTTTVPR